MELNSERLEIGIVTHAKFIRETIVLLGDPLAASTVSLAPAITGAHAATAEEMAKE